MIEIRMPEEESSSSSSSSSSSYSEEEPLPTEPLIPEFKYEVPAIEPESPKTPPPIYVEKKGPAMVSCDTEMVSVLI